MPTLIIDNHDSFTYNLVHAVASITGEMPLVVLNDEKSWEEIRQLRFDHVIISPGPGRPDIPRDFGVSGEVIRNAEVPVLGVCLGHQGIACAFGGTVERGQPMHGVVREVVHEGDPLFAGIPDRFQAVRYHSLMVSEPLPGELKKIAWNAEGAVMALRHVCRPLWGVQFHPESILTEYGTRLLRNFLGVKNTPTFRQRPLIDSPGALFRRYFAGRPGAFWLDGWDGYSYMGAGLPERHTFESLERCLREGRGEAQPVPFPFTGGYVGYFSYEGEGVFVKAERFLVIDHQQNTLYEAGLPEAAALPPLNTVHKCGNIRYRTGREQYLEHIRQCLEWIAAGESYELCLTNQLLLEADIHPLDYYESLRQANPAPCAAYLDFGGTQVACSSPERFLRVDGGGRVESRPIKGTLPLDRDPAELTANERFRAENLMIVDLVRNDLSRVCEPGSVQVPQLMQVESYATVHQLVSTITGQLRGDATAIDCIRAAFPGGSMTGAPKERAMELLAELEDGPRGIYSGSIGYLAFNGTADFNIVIRTAVFEHGKVSIGTGGAIVAHSDPQEEWDELELKAQALLRVFQPT